MGGLLSRKAVPAYPDVALRSGIQGNVILKILVSEEGKIISADAVEGDPLLIAASADALPEFRFTPYLFNGTPIQVESQMEYRFSIKQSGQNAKGEVEYVSSVPFRPEFRTGMMDATGAWILDARQLSGPQPQIPPELAGKSGDVYLTITIGLDGKVQEVKVVGGDEAFIGPVVEAAMQAVYEPRLIGGKPSVSTTKASYHFGPRR